MPADIQARFLHVGEMLEESGPQSVGLPHIRPLEGKLWGMRLRGRDGIARAVYFAATDRRLVVVRILAKKTQATPSAEIALALKRMKEA